MAAARGDINIGREQHLRDRGYRLGNLSIMRWSHVAVLALVHLVTASPLTRRWDELQVKHAWDEIPRGWVLHSEAPADHKLKLRVGLKQDRFDELVEHLYQVSDPAHERYETV